MKHLRPSDFTSPSKQNSPNKAVMELSELENSYVQTEEEDQGGMVVMNENTRSKMEKEFKLYRMMKNLPSFL